jgi:hypothetical protein
MRTAQPISSSTQCPRLQIAGCHSPGHSALFRSLLVCVLLVNRVQTRTKENKYIVLFWVVNPLRNLISLLGLVVDSAAFPSR